MFDCCVVESLATPMKALRLEEQRLGDVFTSARCGQMPRDSQKSKQSSTSANITDMKDAVLPETVEEFEFDLAIPAEAANHLVDD